MHERKPWFKLNYSGSNEKRVRVCTCENHLGLPLSVSGALEAQDMYRLINTRLMATL